MKLSLLFLMIICLFRLNAQIVECSNIGKIEQYLKDDSCLIFDFDNTIAEMVDDIGSVQWIREVINNYIIPSDLDLSVMWVIYNYVQFTNKCVSVEDCTVYCIRNIQEKGIPVFIITLRNSTIADRTLEQITDLGLNFKKSCFYDGCVKFSYKGTIYKDGVLFCNGSDKSVLLKRLLDISGYKIKHLVVVDDDIKHLKVFQKMADEFGIEFIGLRYSYLDEKVASYKLNDNSVNQINNLLVQFSS